mgnify:CR=1 FL=1
MIAASRYTIAEERKERLSFEDRYSWSVKGRWNEVFENDNPVYIEIGMGKGAFLMEQAKRHPDINYVGIEKYSSVLLRAVQKQEEAQLPNLRLIRMEAENINDVFGEGEVKRIYLNFSDPWPKAAHAGRRLTSRQFLKRYDHILSDDGRIEFKTDNQELFDFSLEEAASEESSWEICKMTRDLHNDAEMMKDNIMTEYEERWSKEGKSICGMQLVRKQRK